MSFFWQEQLQTQLTKQIAEKDAVILKLKAYGAVELPQEVLDDSPEGQRVKTVEALKAEIKSLRAKLAVLADAKRDNDVLLDIRTKLMDSLEASKETFKNRCEKLSNFEGEDEVSQQR